MEDMDNRYKEANVDEFSIELESEGSINILSSTVKAAKGFVQNQYGDAFVQYTQNGREEEFSTKSRSATKRMEEPEDVDDFESSVTDLRDQAEGLAGRQNLESEDN